MGDGEDAWDLGAAPGSLVHKLRCPDRQGKEQTEHVRRSEEFGEKRSAIRKSNKSHDSVLFMLTSRGPDGGRLVPVSFQRSLLEVWFQN